MRYVLADVNVWVATLVAEHPFHSEAIRWWQTDLLARDSRIAFCRITQLGLLRLLANQRVMGRQRKTIQQAWALYERLLSRRPVVFSPEPEGTEAALAEYCAPGKSSPKFWTDAYLAAFARAGGMGLVTFDRDFRNFSGLELTLLG